MSQLLSPNSSPQLQPPPHLVSLKVLRTARPSIIDATAAPYYERSSLGGEALTQLGRTSAVNQQDGAGMLLLPSTFGTIYLGSVLLALD